MLAKKTLLTAVVGLSAATPMLAQTASADTGSTTLPGNMAQIEKCESGGNPQAQNPSSTASGLFQDLDTTWRTLPGTSGYARAKDAPASVQIAANIYMYQHQGTSPWLASQPCWGKAGATGVNTTSSAAPSSVTGSDDNSSVSTSSSDATITVPGTPVATNTAPANPGTLTKAEKEDLKAIAQKQSNQSWWTPQARAHKTVTRTVVTDDSGATLHSGPSYTAAIDTATAKKGDKVTGHYVNVDWFQITSGPNAGKFINTDFLTRLPEKNGVLTPSQLATLPNELRANHSSHNQYFGLSSTKSLIEMNAAFRAQFGHNLTVTESYRSLDTQKAYIKTLGSKIAAQPGTSNHGLGHALDLATTSLANKSGAEYQWMTQYDAAFGFNNPTMTGKVTNATVEWWHYNSVG